MMKFGAVAIAALVVALQLGGTDRIKAQAD